MKKINLEKAVKAYIEYKKALGRAHFGPKEDIEQEKLNASIVKDNLDEAMVEVKAAIREAEGSCRERLLEPLAILRWIEVIEGELGISKAQMKGISAKVIDGAQRFPRAYKYTPEATAFWMEHNGRGWVLTLIERVPCNCSHKVELELTDGAKTAIIDRMQRF